MGCGDLVCDRYHRVRDAGHHYLYCYDKVKIMLNKSPFLFFSDEVIAKLYPQWSDRCSLAEFEDTCRKSIWLLNWTGLSYNPIVPISETLSYFGEEIDPNKEYIYEWYELGCGFDKICCRIYYKSDTEEAVAVCFYDA